MSGLNNDFFCKLKTRFLKDGLFTIAVISAFTVLLFVCGPLYIFFPNSEEIWVPLTDILISVGVTSVIAFSALIVFCFLLKDKASEIVVLLLFGSIIGMYVQGLINIRYGSGVLDGSEIDWSKYLWYGIVDSIIWVVCIIIPFIIRKVFTKQYKNIIIFASFILIAMQMSALVVQFVQYKPNKMISITNDKIYELSSDANMLIFILDTMDEAYYKEYIENNEEYTENLDGFVHYDNTLTSGSRTILGVPSMLTGIPFRNESTYSDYIAGVWGGDNPIRSVHNRGVNVGIYSESLLYSSGAAEYVGNFSDKEARLNSHFNLAKKLCKLAGFTYFPHVLKPFFIKRAADFNSLKSGDNLDLYLEDDAAFYDNFVKTGGYTISDEYSKALRIYHLNGAHSPYTLNSEGKRAKSTNCKEQVAGCFKIIDYFINDLKQKKLYDSSYIIIAADHGYYHVGENPMLLVKRPGKEDKYSTSHAPASNFDIPVCIGEFFENTVDTGEFGSSIEDLYEGQIRERHMFYNYRGSMQLQVNEYVTTGKANDKKSLTIYHQYIDERSGNTPYELGTKLLFDTDGCANVYCIEGISGSTGFQSVMYGPESIYRVPISSRPEGHEVVIQLGIGSAGHITEGLNYNIYVNGVTAYQGKTEKAIAESIITISVPADEVFRNDENSIEIKWDFTELDKNEMQNSLLKRTKTYSLKSICIDVE